MWKPGQLITIRGHVYRVKKLHNVVWARCIFCAFKHTEPDVDPCKKCVFSPKLSSGDTQIPPNCYLKEVL